jgi:ACS family tartrate transporter-like MFS transporter
MGLIAGALLNLDGHLGLRGWQWLFLVEGLPAVLLGIAFFMFLPDTPAHAKWLTDDERLWIIHHVNEAPSATDHHDDSILHALLDSRVWQLGIFMLFNLASLYAYTFVAPDIVQRSTHLSTTIVGFIIAGLSLLGALGMLLNAAHSDRTQERYWHIIPCCLLLSLGFVICGVSTRPLIAVPALGLLIVAYNAMQGPLWSLPATFLTGRSGAAGIAAINTIGITGGFLGPYFIGFAKDLTGDYQSGLRLMAIPMLVGAGIMLYLRRDARRRQIL